MQVQESTPISLFTMVGIVIASLLAVLIAVGALWNLFKTNRRKKEGEGEQSEESEASDSDSMELDLQNTDLESRLGNSRPPSRARSYRSRRRSPMSVRTARTWSPSPPSSLVDEELRS